jgi:recombination protein RecT
MASKEQKPTDLIKQEDRPITLRDRFQEKWFKEQVATVLSTGANADRFIRVATTALLTTRNLGECDEASVFRCLFSLAQTGLEVDGRNAHLIPRWNKNRKPPGYECTFQIDYKGYVELAMKSGLVSSVHADLVFDADEFEYDMGIIKCHKPNYRVKRLKGTWYCVYSIVRFKDGSIKCEVMTNDEVMEIRDRSQSWIAYKKDEIKSCPWSTDAGEMSKKTVFKRLSKWLSLSPELNAALDHENDDFDPLPHNELPGNPPNMVIPPEDEGDRGGDDRRSVTPTGEREVLHPEFTSETKEEEPANKQEAREKKELNPPEDAGLPSPVQNVVNLIRVAKTELRLAGVKQMWLAIKKDHPEHVEMIEKMIEAKSASVVAEGQKPKS